MFDCNQKYRTGGLISWTEPLFHKIDYFRCDLPPEMFWTQCAIAKTQTNGKCYTCPVILSVIFKSILGEDQRLVTVRASVDLEPSGGYCINLHCLGTSDFESPGHWWPYFNFVVMVYHSGTGDFKSIAYTCFDCGYTLISVWTSAVFGQVDCIYATHNWYKLIAC